MQVFHLVHHFIGLFALLVHSIWVGLANAKSDDMLIMSDHVNVEIMLRNLQGKMNRMYKWCRLNKLIINEVKTKYMVIGSGKIEPMQRISINSRVIGKVTQYNILE